MWFRTPGSPSRCPDCCPRFPRAPTRRFLTKVVPPRFPQGSPSRCSDCCPRFRRAPTRRFLTKMDKRNSINSNSSNIMINNSSNSNCINSKCVIFFCELCCSGHTLSFELQSFFVKLLCYKPPEDKAVPLPSALVLTSHSTNQARSCFFCRTLISPPL